MRLRLDGVATRVTAVVVGALLVGCYSGCSGTKLTDVDSVTSSLDLTDGQARVARPHIERIAVAVEDYEADKQALVEEMQARRPGGGRGGGGGFGSGGGRGGRGGGRGGGEMEARRTEMREKMEAFNAKRVAYQQVIDTALSAIVGALDEDQREKFAKIETPELTMPEAPSRGGGRGGAGGGGRGGGLGGGVGGGRR